jgi:hypothetical protein
MQERLLLGCELNLSGAHVSIVHTLRRLSATLEKEVKERTSRQAEIMCDASFQTRVDASEFTRLLGQVSTRLKSAFRRTQTALGEAASPQGSPELFRLAYATFLEQLLVIANALWSVKAPDAFGLTERAYRDFVQSLYEQAGRWGPVLGVAAVSVTGDACCVPLTVSYDDLLRKCDLHRLRREWDRA